METIGAIVIIVVWYGVKIWWAWLEEKERVDVRREERMMKRADRVATELAAKRRFMYAKMHAKGRLHDIMTDQQVEDLLDDFYEIES